MVQQKADDIEVGPWEPKDLKWTEIRGTQERVEIASRLEGRRDDSAVPLAVQRNRLVTQPGCSRRCAGLGPLEYESADDGRGAVFERGRKREICRVGCH